MRLSRPFFRLPLRFDPARLQAEVDSLPPTAWAAHPNAIAGNSSVRLISVGGGENDDVVGEMLPTAHLQALPYLRHVLARFGVVWSRSRLLRLAPGATVPQHSDINHHWFYRVRVHVPIRTRPEVVFRCDGEAVHMAAGEAWVFDNWRQHSVENLSPEERIHLVADTSGTAAFWSMVAGSERQMPSRPLAFDPAADPPLLTERALPPPVMPPTEVDHLVGDLRRDLAAADDSPASASRVARLDAVLGAFCHDWRQCHALHGDDPCAPDYASLVDGLREASRTLSDGLMMRSNRVAAHKVLEGRVLRALLHRWRRRFERPVFIVAAPRSGSTLLFETLSSCGGVLTVGGEGHFVFEGLQHLRPGAGGVDSNRLLAEHATEAVRSQVHRSIEERLRGPAAGGPTGAAPRFLEKTPKNVLRIPFLDALFPDSLFIFLWREPEPNLSSIIEAWRSGRFKTYAGLPGFSGPWSLLLPPGWQAMDGRPVEEIAAFQWESANRTALDDLSALPRERWTSVRFDDLVRDPRAVIERLCGFAGLEIGPALDARLSADLPLSRQTLTPPAPGKWQANAALIDRVSLQVAATRERLRALG